MSGQLVRSLGKTAMTVAVAAGLAACGGGPQNSTGPSAIPSSLTAGQPPTIGNDRYYGVTISPSVVNASSTTAFTVTFTNCNGAGTCDGSATSDSGSNASFASASIAVPAGFINVVGLGVSASGGKSWSVALSSGTIVLGANAGGPGGVNANRIAAGESLVVTFTATAPASCDSYDWITNAYQDALSGGAIVTDTPYTLVGSQPSVAVTGCVSGCTLTQGYWKEHGPIPSGNNSNEWPVSSLTLGTVLYTDVQLLDILNTAPAGNGLIDLAHQLIAAKLNIANGADPTAIASTIASADTLIGALVVPPVGSGSLSPSATGALITALTDYNEGTTGPGHCSGT